MKYLTLCLLIVASSSVMSQNGYISLKGLYFPDPANGGGGTVSAGYHKNGMSAGVGVGIIAFNGNTDPYVPIFAEVNAIPMKTKLSPYIAAQFGYGLYKGTGKFIGEDRYVKGGFYSNFLAGAAYGRKTKVILYGGIAPVILNDDKKRVRNPNSYSKGLFTVGIGFIGH